MRGLPPHQRALDRCSTLSYRRLAAARNALVQGAHDARCRHARVDLVLSTSRLQLSMTLKVQKRRPDHSASAMKSAEQISFARACIVNGLPTRSGNRRCTTTGAASPLGTYGVGSAMGQVTTCKQALTVHQLNRPCLLVRATYRMSWNGRQRRRLEHCAESSGSSLPTCFVGCRSRG